MELLNSLSGGEFSCIRVFKINEEAWFIGKDICKFFGDTNHNRTISRVDDCDKQYIEIEDSMGRKQNAIAVNESGMYSILFSMQPQKANNGGGTDAYPIEIQQRIEKLKRFKHWVTSEVLPSIRKTGQYQMPNLSKEMQAIVLLDTRTVQMQERLDRLEYDIPLYGSEADELSDHVKRKGVAVMGGKNSEAYKDTAIRAAVYRDIYNQIKREFGIYSDDGRPKSYKALKRKYIYDAHELIDAYEVTQYLRELIEAANAQMSLAV